MFSHVVVNFYNGLSALLLILLVALLLAVLVMFIVDVSQSRNAVRRNYPVIGRFRGLFEHLGTFFRQYFFAMDREEMPFEAGSLFNISGMSYGALSKVAVQALSQGAAKAGCWMNTGEGGLTLKESLPMLIDHLVGYGLRERVRVICSGKLITPSGVAWALCMGADFIVSARGFMFALGCIQAMQCHKNICLTGITTHQKRLQRGLVPQDKAARVAHYVENMRHDVGVISHSCGVKHPRLLQRRHARVVIMDSSSAGLHIIHPETEIGFPHGKPKVTS